MIYPLAFYLNQLEYFSKKHSVKCNVLHAWSWPSVHQVNGEINARKLLFFQFLKGENSILHLNFLVAHLNLAIIYASQGRYADAEKVIVFMLLHVNCNVYWIET